MVDHIDGDRLNNKIENLRWATPKENANNIHLEKTPESLKFKNTFLLRMSYALKFGRSILVMAFLI